MLTAPSCRHTHQGSSASRSMESLKKLSFFLVASRHGKTESDRKSSGSISLDRAPRQDRREELHWQWPWRGRSHAAHVHHRSRHRSSLASAVDVRPGCGQRRATRSQRRPLAFLSPSRGKRSCGCSCRMRSLRCVEKPRPEKRQQHPRAKGTGGKAPCGRDFCSPSGIGVSRPGGQRLRA